MKLCGLVWVAPSAVGMQIIIIVIFVIHIQVYVGNITRFSHKIIIVITIIIYLNVDVIHMHWALVRRTDGRPQSLRTHWLSVVWSFGPGTTDSLLVSFVGGYIDCMKSFHC